MTGFSVTFERYLPHDDDEDICEPDEIGLEIEGVSLREAMQVGLGYLRPSWAGYCEADCYPPRGARWLVFPTWNEGTREEIEQGISESRSLHIPDHVTEASRGRIVRLFKAYGWEKS
jgi:hypothetical protein